MEKILYYPGCTLKNRAKVLDECARKSALALGYELIEPENWQCCGGAYISSKDEIATKLASVRVLAAARSFGGRVLTVCSACYNVLKQTNNELRTNPEFDAKVNRYLSPDIEYHGECEVIHFFEFLRDEIGFDVLAEKVKNPLNAKVAPYYGCMLLRPSSVLKFDDPEDPVIMENFIRALGGEAVFYSFRNECCGGYMSVANPDRVKRHSSEVCASAAEFGADYMVTACPLCMYNLKKNSSVPVNVKYFTEVLAEALGV